MVAPVGESLLLGGHALAHAAALEHSGSALVAGIAWGMLHGLFAPARFFGTGFPFLVFVFACCWMTWRQRSFRHALAAAALPHAAHNLLVRSVGALSGRDGLPSTPEGPAHASSRDGRDRAGRGTIAADMPAYPATT
ncbi:hypothetical protein [Pseudoxanthomonas suwonensis]|uniref:hypothetical protein n=1 Tax=Pseudoxanthomonas suwonensis TaxID=314722 RepID=UPI001FE88A23|nr:hypothetical protein [Pseudoxanthomonas suwonensis]